MNQTFQEIQRLDAKRMAMKMAIKELNEKLGEDINDIPKLSGKLDSLSKSGDKKSQSGMVYPTLRKWNR